MRNILIMLALLLAFAIVVPAASYVKSEAKEERARQARLEEAQEDCRIHLKDGWDFIAKNDAVRALLESSDPGTAILVLASYGGEEALEELLERLDIILEKEYYGPA